MPPVQITWRYSTRGPTLTLTVAHILAVFVCLFCFTLLLFYYTHTLTLTLTQTHTHTHTHTHTSILLLNLPLSFLLDSYRVLLRQYFRIEPTSFLNSVQRRRVFCSVRMLPREDLISLMLQALFSMMLQGIHENTFIEWAALRARETKELLSCFFCPLS